MNIIETTTYEVNGETFKTRQEAEVYHLKQTLVGYVMADSPSGDECLIDPRAVEDTIEALIERLGFETMSLLLSRTVSSSLPQHHVMKEIKAELQDYHSDIPVLLVFDKALRISRLLSLINKKALTQAFTTNARIALSYISRFDFDALTMKDDAEEAPRAVKNLRRLLEEARAGIIRD